ncbi:MAG: biopolymer transporter ExbD [Polyangiaceae bacterium]|nr:biopolymer transporter ExbD [Polyangiaceae bacterium]
MRTAAADDDGTISGINVTPLVDICLVLLIIMMVTAHSFASLSLPMDLPRRAGGPELQVLFSVDLAPNDVTLVDGNQVDRIEEVMPLAREAIAKTPGLRATIRADPTVSHGRVMRVVDLLKQAGVGHIAFGAPAPNPGKKD